MSSFSAPSIISEDTTWTDADTDDDTTMIISIDHAVTVADGVTLRIETTATNRIVLLFTTTASTIRLGAGAALSLDGVVLQGTPGVSQQYGGALDYDAASAQPALQLAPDNTGQAATLTIRNTICREMGRCVYQLPHYWDIDNTAFQLTISDSVFVDNIQPLRAGGNTVVKNCLFLRNTDIAVLAHRMTLTHNNTFACNQEGLFQTSNAVSVSDALFLHNEIALRHGGAADGTWPVENVVFYGNDKGLAPLRGCCLRDATFWRNRIGVEIDSYAPAQNYQEGVVERVNLMQSTEWHVVLQTPHNVNLTMLYWKSKDVNEQGDNDGDSIAKMHSIRNQIQDGYSEPSYYGVTGIVEEVEPWATEPFGHDLLLAFKNDEGEASVFWQPPETVLGFAIVCDKNAPTGAPAAPTTPTPSAAPTMRWKQAPTITTTIPGKSNKDGETSNPPWKVIVPVLVVGMLLLGVLGKTLVFVQRRRQQRKEGTLPKLTNDPHKKNSTKKTTSSTTTVGGDSDMTLEQ